MTKRVKLILITSEIDNLSAVIKVKIKLLQVKQEAR